ncbi:MAG: NADH-quinone oxidoreductase subunit NuoF [Thermoplasmata archaeon]|nr:MAG: NADH-quinone oxidoreductase subunit NuoF [Thermoplasmata archaeon]
MKKISSLEELEKLRERISSSKGGKKTKVLISTKATCCQLQKSEQVTSALFDEIEKNGQKDKVEILTTGCLGFCELEPIIVIKPKGILYKNIKVDDVSDIVAKTILKGEIIEKLLYVNPLDEQRIELEDDIPFYSKQNRILLGNNSNIDPDKIEDYIASGGYSALSKVLSGMKPDEIIEEIKKSGLRGRGGAGFPTGRKWESCRNTEAEDDIKYVICNADEGDPGAYMDRNLLESNPHSVLEGMIIGAYSIGSHNGYIYVRNEYELAVSTLKNAIKQAREYGFLGKDILGSGFDFTIKLSRGGGAFVCGESTALMASIEGKPGEPRAKHIHTTTKGLWDRPTNLNNVETWANVPLIINSGADWYSKIGMDKSKGTKIFSLVGKIHNTGLVEVPMGTTLRDIIFKIGGGIPGERKFKAVQTGGPSGGCIPEHLLDLPVDYEKLTEAGSMMGSGGMIVMDDRTCMVDVARYFTNFLKDESCGKCVPCRNGLIQLHHMLTDICEGRGSEKDLDFFEELGFWITNGSLCQLGTTAVNPVQTTLRYFKDEYLTHIVDKKCPAGVCKALITFTIDSEKCTGCEVCKKNCPQDAISGEKKEVHDIDQDKCIKCGICEDSCKFDAVEVN